MNQLMFEQFVLADNSRVLCSVLFKQLKKDILRREGILCGYETVVVREYCRKCAGSGERFIKRHGEEEKRETCYACSGSGYRVNENRYYLRYALRGIIFRMRANIKPNGEPVEIHQGYPASETTDITIAYRAMLILFAYYNEELLTKLLTYSPPAQSIWGKEKNKILKLIETQKAA